MLGRGLSGNGNHQTNPYQAEKNIASSCRQALDEAGLMQEDVHFAYFGLAGADRDSDYQILNPMISRLGFPKYRVACDTMIAMRAGSGRSYGVVVISGTGFNAAARNKAGEELQYGGFGYLFGDGQGSGRGLADLAFRTAVRSWDGRGKASILQDMVLAATGFSSIPQMLDAVLDDSFVPPLELAETMFDAAKRGDRVAIEILKDQGKELGNAAAALIKRLNMQNDEFDVVLGGSVLAKSTPTVMRDALQTRLLKTAPKASVITIKMEPVAGAVLSAMDRGGHVVNQEIVNNLTHISFSERKGE
ncbi:BadF/BadG/BcrA/BcrD ATPase family protein [compost metagenome]